MTRTNNEKWTSLRKPTLALVIAMALWAMLRRLRQVTHYVVHYIMGLMLSTGLC